MKLHRKLLCGLAVFGMATSFAIAADPSTTTRETSISGKSDKALGELERANKLIGKQVRSSDDQKLGKLENLIVDLESGRVLYAIVGSGGILGAGEKKFAVAPGAFTEAQGSDAHLNVDKAQFQGAPEFTKDIDRDTEISKADFVSRVYAHYHQNAWWQGKTAANEGSFNNVHKANDVIGMKVMNVSNQEIGKVDNLMINLPAGRIAYVILNPDRSLALGNDYYALPPSALTLSSDRKNLVSDINKEKLAAAPHFAKNNWPTLSDPAWAAQVYQYYGKQAYFDASGSLRPTSEQGKERIYQDKK